MKPILSILLLLAFTASAQTGVIIGKLLSEGKAVERASISLAGTVFGAWSDSLGSFMLSRIPAGTYQLRVSCLGYDDAEQQVAVKSNNSLTLCIVLTANDVLLNDVVVTGVSRATQARENPVAIMGISSPAMERTAASDLMDVLARNVP